MMPYCFKKHVTLSAVLKGNEHDKSFKNVPTQLAYLFEQKGNLITLERN